MEYKEKIIDMISKMENEDFLFKAYHYILAKFRKERGVDHE